MTITLLVRVKGGAGSGNYGHAGRPGMVGGSGGFSRTTVPVSVIGGEAYVDEAAAEYVSNFNAAGMETSAACSGHVGEESLTTTLSVRHNYATVSKVDVLRNFIRSGKLSLDWHMTDKPGGWHDLYPKDGFYGSGKLPSTRENVMAANRDMLLMSEVV